MTEKIWENVPRGPNADHVIGPSFIPSEEDLAASGSIFSMMRVLEGHVAGLGPKWFGGSAKLQPGQIRISGLVVQVSKVRLASAYRAGLRHHDHRPLAAIQVESRDAVLEWLLPEDQLEHAVHRVGSGRHPAVLDRAGLPEAGDRT